MSEFVAEVRELVSEMNEVEADRRKELVNVQPVEYASFDNVWGMPIDAFIPFQSTSSNIQWAATDVLESVNTPQLRALFKSQPKRRRIIESESETEEFEDRGGIAGGAWTRRFTIARVDSQKMVRGQKVPNKFKRCGRVLFQHSERQSGGKERLF